MGMTTFSKCQQKLILQNEKKWQQGNGIKSYLQFA